MKSFTVTSFSNLKKFTASVYPQGSFCLDLLLKNRDVKVNGARVGADVPLKVGDEVTFYTTAKQENMPSHSVVYEDENVLVADKYSGVESEGLLSELCAKGEYYAVHRLDRNTQGLIAFAKNRGAEEELLSAFKERRVQKTYIALCKNNFKVKEAVLTAYLVKDGKSSAVRVYDRMTSGGVKIVTEYKVLEDRGDVALVAVVLHTGKTHQIRAHTAFIGCPVLGDTKYGDKALNKKYGAARQKLVSKKLVFDLRGGLEYLNETVFESGFSL